MRGPNTTKKFFGVPQHFLGYEGDNEHGTSFVFDRDLGRAKGN